VNSILVVLCSLILPMSVALRQSSGTTGSISGTVYDDKGAIVDSAKIEIKDADGGSQRADTDAQGNFNIPGLDAGTYTIIVTASGFQPFENDNFDLREGDDAHLDVNLTPEKTDSDNNPNASLDLSRGAFLVETASALWPR
jgi:hypothetical protein